MASMILLSLLSMRLLQDAGAIGSSDFTESYLEEVQSSAIDLAFLLFVPILLLLLSRPAAVLALASTRVGIDLPIRFGRHTPRFENSFGNE